MDSNVVNQINERYKLEIESNNQKILALKTEIDLLKTDYSIISEELKVSYLNTSNNNNASVGSAFIDKKEKQYNIALSINEKEDQIRVLSSNNERLIADKKLELLTQLAKERKILEETSIISPRLREAVDKDFTKEDKKYLIATFIKILILFGVVFIIVKLVLMTRK